VSENAEKKFIEEKLSVEKMYPVFLTRSEVEKYYDCFCNKTIWPLFHYFNESTIFDKSFWKVYEDVNNIFCEEVIKYVKPNDLIWVQDYHLLLLPKLIRQKIPDASIGFFLHIPFPSYEVFRLLPWKKEILNGLLGADLIAFHTYDYVRHFLSAVFRVLGIESELSSLIVGDRIVNVDSFPIGIDFNKFFESSQNRVVKREISKIRKEMGDRKTILSIDRLDYTKGILNRLEAFKLFLEKYPEYKEKVTLILVTVPSRTKVEQYKYLKEEVDKLVGNINGKHDRIGWIPILYFYRSLPFSTLAAFYNIADVALVTPLRDGMNLIAKEYIASKSNGKGVLVLSDTAGASKFLGKAISINPNDIEEIADSLNEALKMQEEEQISRNVEMQEQLKRYDITWWVRGFTNRLIYTKKIQDDMAMKILNAETKNKIIDNYHKSKRRLVILDYDGTLISFVETPEKAVPDDELLKYLKKFTDSQKDKLVLISGRKKDTLEKWFGELNVEMVAEHGAWVKEARKQWETLEPLAQEWKEKINEILESFVDRTPGSFVEEKDFSLVWHYRKTAIELGKIRASELIETLSYFIANLNLQVLEGNKVIEVRNSGINKGKGALRWIDKEDWDFILAIGDDKTDEDTFKVLPEKAYSIKVGLGYSAAKHNINSPDEVREILRRMMEVNNND